MQNLFLIRGLPGSGKSTLVKQLGLTPFEADQFFVTDGVYNFNPSLIGEAHQDCIARTRHELQKGRTVAVSNTFAKHWEMSFYIDMANELNIRLTVVDLFDGGCTDEELFERNLHGVPLEVIKAMRERWQHDWKEPEPTPVE